MAIQMPEKKPGLFGQIAPIVGTVGGGIAGAFAGNPVLGASLGGAAGRAAAGVAEKDVGKAADAAVGGVASASGDAMTRRLEKLRASGMTSDAAPAEDPLDAVRQAAYKRRGY